MKWMWTIGMASCLLVFAYAAFPMVVIHLEDGRTFVTEQYLEEGDQIRFRRYGGFVGIPKALVKDIEVCSEGCDVVFEEGGESGPEGQGGGGVLSGKSRIQGKADGAPERCRPFGADEKRSADEGLRETDESPQAEPKPTDEAYFRGKKQSLESELAFALDQYRQARLSGEKEVMDIHFRRASRLASELEDLKKAVRNRHGGILPEWWHSEP